MTPDLIAAAVLFGPTAGASTALARAVLRARRDSATEAAVFAELRTTTPPDGGGEPLIYPGESLATVLSFPTRRNAA
jgi:hypothetical protein